MIRIRGARGRGVDLFIVLACVAWLGACGGDDKKDKPDAGEPCPVPGNSQTGCVCSPDQPLGHRECNQNKIWSPCSCPPPAKAEQCVEGATVTCSVCPGETVGRATVCLQSGTYDCSCSTPAGSAGRGRN